MPKWLLLIFILGLLLGVSHFVLAQSKVEVDFFYSPTCPYCAKEKIFLQQLKDKYPDIKINQYDVVNSQENQRLLKELYQKYEVADSLMGLVPVTFTPTKYFVGFDDKIAAELESCLEKCLHPEKEELALTYTSAIEKTFTIPFLGEIKTDQLSFPAMAIVLGVLDGFNVCSLGALILILSLVLSLNSRKRIIIFGGAYLLTTAVVYGFLIFFWYKLFETVAPYLKAMNILIGALGVGGGAYFLWQFFKFRKSQPTCQVGPGEKISARFLPKLQELFKKPGSIFLAVGAVLAFAFILTVIEFPCSAVIPVAFAAVLAKAGLPTVSYFFYIALFVLFYLLDEIIIFLLAVGTCRIWLSSPRFLKWMLLLEAVILFLLGLYHLL